MVKKLKLDTHYLSKASRGFAQIIQTNVLTIASGGLESKKPKLFAFQSMSNFDFFQNSSCTFLVPARPG
jgi:hypothetical protein